MANGSVIICVLCSLLFACVHTASVNTTQGTDSPSSPRLRRSDREYWTEWYDVDNPVSGDGDYETVESITRALSRNICPSTHSIARADCAVDNDDVDDPPREDNLALPCSTAGLACRNKDQAAGICNNYRVRFFCQPRKGAHAQEHTTPDKGEERNDTSSAPRFDMRIYIILAAIPIVIFLFRLCWSCTFEKRRRRNRRPTRPRRRPATDEEAAHPEVFLPPPSYQELFGLNGGPFLLSRHYSLCRKCKSSQCGIFRDRHLTNPDTETSNDSLSASSEHEADVMVTMETTSLSEGSPSSSRSNSLSESNSSESSASTTNTDLEPGDSSSTQPVQPSQCDCPCHKQAPEVSVYDNPAYEPEVEIHNGRSPRIPGMHLPVFALFRSASAASLDEAPPPTYKEALKILKKNKKGNP
ncbi:mucin-5AC-like [Haliotis rufescens]|uniref:mucin-5AC-like n=1 Tax=Haliotis rufescens TaxID=6454 RepID=UPI00201EDFF6|nr:mucin-5AC-like [Haliotis rufescens]